MKISVIIPVYNAEKYVRNAIESALQQPETGEILLVEDNSPDNCLQICRDLEKKHEIVELLRHPDGRNHGAGASRNLGIKNAKFDYISFLDADDYYLPERFKEAKKLFRKYDDIEGVYEATGTHFYDAQVKQRWISSGREDLATLTERADPTRLFETLLKSGKGYIHLDGLVVKQKIFEHCGYFFEHLRLHQDTALLFQISAYGKLIPGRLNTPVAMRGLHSDNRILSDYNRHQTKSLLWKTLFHWAKDKDLEFKKIRVLFQNYMYHLCSLRFKNQRPFSKKVPYLTTILSIGLTYPFLSATAAVHLSIGHLRRRLRHD